MDVPASPGFTFQKQIQGISGIFSEPQSNMDRPTSSGKGFTFQKQIPRISGIFIEPQSNMDRPTSSGKGYNFQKHVPGINGTFNEPQNNMDVPISSGSHPGYVMRVTQNTRMTEREELIVESTPLTSGYVMRVTQNTRMTEREELIVESTPQTSGARFYSGIPTTDSWSEPSHLGITYPSTMGPPVQLHQGTQKPVSPEYSISSTSKEGNILSPTVSSTISEGLATSFPLQENMVTQQMSAPDQQMVVPSSSIGAQIPVSSANSSGVYCYANAVTSMPVSVAAQPDCAGSSSQVEAQQCNVSSTNSPLMTSKKKVTIQEKDDSYWVKRKKNNDSARRSRENRRYKEAMVNFEYSCSQVAHQRLQVILGMLERFLIDSEMSCLRRKLYIPCNELTNHVLDFLSKSTEMLHQELWARLKRLKMDAEGSPLPAHQGHYHGPLPSPGPPRTSNSFN